MNITKHTSDIWSISDFWSSEVCDACINETEAAGLFPTSPDQLHDLSNIGDNISSNSRIYFTSNELAQSIWIELQNLVPQQYKKSKAVGINETFRFYKYLPGQEFKKHRDNAFTRDEFEKSFYSLLIYLNDNFEGGNTIFDTISLQPQKGTAVIFPHHLEHTGSVVTKGMKYILRSDIMYKLIEEPVGLHGL